MSWKCDVCGKRKVIGGQITHRGLSKKKGGIGLQLVKNFKRPFYPNLQSVRVRQGEAVQRMKVCTRCIRSGKIQKA